MKNVQGIQIKKVNGKIELHLTQGLNGKQLSLIQGTKEYKKALAEVEAEKEEGDRFAQL